MNDAELAVAARLAANHSYSPYSHFSVGAAVRFEDGRIYTGTNVESASYGLTICAERAAIATAITAGNRRLQALAVYAAADQPPMPCGACLQVMAEFGTDIPIDLVWSSGNEQTTLSLLLPRPYRPSGGGL